MSNFIDITGNKYNRLTVLYRMPAVKGEKPRWMCRCDCGNETVVAGSHLKRKVGATTSCGCYKKERVYECNKKYNEYVFDCENNLYTGTTSKGVQFTVDLDDYDKVKNYCWFIHHGYLTAKDSDSHILLHRLVLNAKNSEIVDHIDMDKLNNTKSNLRIVNDFESASNKPLRKDNTSGIIGVYKYNKTGKFGARIRNKNKSIHLGYFMDKEDAIKARLYGELKYFGYEFSPQRHLFEKYEINVPKTIVKEEG